MTTQTTFADTAELAARITILAIEISKAGRYHAFAEYMGHVDSFAVKVLPGDQVYAADVPQAKLYESWICLGRDPEADKRHLENAYACLQEFAKQEAA